MLFSTGWILFSSLWVVSSTWTIRIRTADRENAGTDSNVTIKLFGDEHEISSDIQCINRFENDFKRGGHDEFSIDEEHIKGFTQNTTLKSIELWTTSVGTSPDWKVDSIVIDNPLGNTTFPFPLFRWLQPGRHYNVSLYDTSLPQHEHFVEQRLAELSEAKLNYEYHQNLRNLSLVGVKDLPADDGYSQKQLARRSMQRMEAATNIQLAIYTYGNTWESFESIKDIFSYKYSQFDELYSSSSFFRRGNDTTCERGNKLPEGLDDWDDDVHFGLQRLTGVNTHIIKLFSRKYYRKTFPITYKLLESLLEGMTIQKALRKRRLFVCDYNILDGIKPKDNFTQCAPIGLFFLDNAGNLKPIAIQLFQAPGPDNPIFTPLDSPTTWTFVKMWFNTADVAYHQAVTHLGGTHLIMEGILVASHRNLARSHPIFKLLAPHFLLTLQVNTAIPPGLMNEGAVFDRLTGLGSDGLLEVMSRYVSSWRMDLHGDLPEFLKQRGVDDPDVLPGFHYRDDALLLHRVIHDYTREYVALYYTSPEILHGDSELQNWAGDLVRPINAPSPGCGLQGVPGNGELTTADQLVQILTYIIYTCSVGHASVDNKQYSQIPYPPNYPTVLSGAPPTSKAAIVTDRDILHSLVNRQQALAVMKTLDSFGDIRANSLGNFEIDYVVDPPAVKVVDRFKGRIREVSATIKQLNKFRSPPYESLDPDNIRNSIAN